jgi:hypothetical protein
MGKIYEIKITDFSKGITSEPRLEDSRFCQMVKNFDIHSYPKKIVPFRDMVSGDNAAATSKKQNFCVALRTTSPSDIYSLYALGVVTETTRAEILYKNLTTGAATDLDDDDWTYVAASNNHQAPGDQTKTSFNLFVYYRKVNSGKGLIYGAADETYIWAFSPGDATAFAYNSHPLVYTDIQQGLVHSKYDILFIPYTTSTGTFIAKNDNGSWNDTALTLPSYLKITSICEYGNYLAIACAPRSRVGNSKVFLWDMTSTDVMESIDFGEGNLVILEEIEGHLIGISYFGYPNSFKGKVVFRQYSGGVATIFNQLWVDESIIIEKFAKQKVNQYLYFPLTCKKNGVTLRGIWKIGRQTPNDPFALSMDRFAENDETDTALTGFFIIGDYVFVSYLDTATPYAYHLSKTNSTVSYTATSIYESLIQNLGDSRLKKKLLGITVMTESLPALGQVVLKYQKDKDVGGTTWTTIFTHSPTTAGSFIVGREYKITTAGTTDFTLIGAADNNVGTVFTATGVGTGTGTAIDNLISHSCVTSLPEFKEIVFRIESTGGAVITGFEYKVEIIGKDIYE